MATTQFFRIATNGNYGVLSYSDLWKLCSIVCHPATNGNKIFFLSSRSFTHCAVFRITDDVIFSDPTLKTSCIEVTENCKNINGRNCGNSNDRNCGRKHFDGHIRIIQYNFSNESVQLKKNALYDSLFLESLKAENQKFHFPVINIFRTLIKILVPKQLV